MLPLHQLSDELNRERLALAELRRAYRRNRSWRIMLRLWLGAGLRNTQSIPVGVTSRRHRAAAGQ